MDQKAFTLIELLIVIAIVAILSAIIILVLNPAQLLAQSRDANRIHDMGVLKTSVGLYLVDVKAPALAISYTTCYLSTTSTLGPQCGSLFSATYVTNNYSSSRAVDSSGWLPINFATMSVNSPLGGSLPRDPVNNGTYYYAYVASATTLTYEINAHMESVKYSTGSKDVQVNDGGDVSNWLEVGSNPGLKL